MPVLDGAPKLEILERTLEDDRWDFWTAEGLAADLHVPPEAVLQAFRAHPEIVRKSVLTDRNGRELFTASSRPLTWRERIERFRSVL